MRAIGIALILSAPLTMSMPGAVGAAESYDFGKREYEARCAACHGKHGRGDGPYAGVLDTYIPDLTSLRARNNGVFPAEHVQATIDGRERVARHGSRDMPVWGAEYRLDAQASHMDVPYDPEAFVRTRVLALSAYLNRLQAK